jgi:DNA repair protein RecO (recombination protein O)
LQEGDLLKGPQRLRHDWRRLGMAVNCARVLEFFQVGLEGAEETYFLFAALLNMLEDRDYTPALLPMFFRMRLAACQGYALRPEACSVCGRAWEPEDIALLSPRESSLSCRRCAPVGGGRVTFSPEALRVLRHVLECAPSAWDFAAYAESAQKECAGAVDKFLRYSAGLYWENGRFRRI